MRNLTASILVPWMILACNSSGMKKETYTLPDEQLARLFLDLQLSEVTLSGLPAEKADSLKRIYTRRLTEIYHISEADIRAEIQKLESDPEKMKVIVDRAKAIADSIR